MKKMTLLGTAIAATILSSQAHAVTFAGSVTDLNFRDHDLGLVIGATPTAFGPFTLNNVGDYIDLKVFNVGTGEGSVELDDLVKYPISATFGFTAPNASTGVVSGTTNGFFNLLGKRSDPCSLLAGQGGCGQADFSSLPTTLNFANNVKLTVQLFDTTFKTPGTSDVIGRFTLSAVPEPSTWAMMIMGIGFAGVAMRTRRRQQVSLTYA